MKKILVTTAGAVAANETAEYIVGIAKQLDAELVAFHVLAAGESDEACEETLRIFSGWGKKLDVPVTTAHGHGNIVAQIIERAEKENIDLIVMGASRGKVVSEWISANVMGRMKTPVLVIPHELKLSQISSSTNGESQR